MLSTEAVDRLVKAKAVQPWLPLGVLTARRALYVTTPVLRALTGPWPVRNGEKAEDVAERRQDLIDLVALWTRGDPMSPRLVKPLEPPPPCDGVWEMRAQNVQPGARLFGMFPSRNIYVATTVVPRDTLGNAGSQPWTNAIQYAAAMAKTWFPSEAPILWPAGRVFGRSDVGVVCDDF